MTNEIKPGTEVTPGRRNSTMTVRELRTLLHGVADQDAPIEVLKEFKYGKVVATQTITGIRFELDDHGTQHILIK